MLHFSKHSDSGDKPVAVLSSAPTAEDLQFALSQAQRNWRRAVALAFKTSAHPVMFTVLVQCEMGTGEPVWTLKKGDEECVSVVWSHKSTDVHLIQSLLAVEFDAQSKDSHMESPEAYPQSVVEAVKDDVPDGFPKFYREAVGQVIGNLCNPDTGIFTYESFIYFVDQEYRRYLRGGQPFSVVVFQMQGKAGGSDALPTQLITEEIQGITLKILKMIRDIDFIGHYGTHEFALLLPHTEAEGAATLARRVKVAVCEGTGTSLGVQRLLMSFGVASIPGDCKDPVAVMALAEEAKNHAMAGEASVMMYRDLL